jgi:hypothetical protein
MGEKLMKSAVVSKAKILKISPANRLKIEPCFDPCDINRFSIRINLAISVQITVSFLENIGNDRSSPNIHTNAVT